MCGAPTKIFGFKTLARNGMKIFPDGFFLVQSAVQPSLPMPINAIVAKFR